MSDKRHQIIEYFVAPKPSFPVKAVVIAAIVLLLGIAVGAATSGAVILIAILVAGAVGTFPVLSFLRAKRRYEERPSDQQMDTWLVEDMQQIVKKDALNKLGLDPSQLVAEELMIPGPVYWNVSGLDPNEVRRRGGRDGFYRYSVWNLEVFLLTDKYLANYGCTYNWLRNTSVNEHTKEFFYRDVVSVRTATESSAYTLRNGTKLEHAQSFELRLSGDSVSVVTNDATLKTSAAMTSRVDKAVQAIRTMLRDKKS